MITACKRASIATILAAALAIVCVGSGPMASDLVSAFRKERQKDSTPHLDVTHLLQSRIAVGMDTETARQLLLSNGFKITESNLPDGSQILMGTRREKSGIPPFIYDQYRITLTIRRGQIEAVSANIFLQTL